MALPQVNRLKHRRDFAAVYRYGLRRSTRHFTLRALHPPQSTDGAAPSQPGDSDSDPPRVGISISQKVSKRAVVRNRIKRQIRAAVHQLLPQISPNWDLVFVVHPGADQCDYHQILQELKQLLADTEVINGR